MSVTALGVVFLVLAVAVIFLLVCIRASMTLEKIPEDIFREEAEQR